MSSPSGEYTLAVERIGNFRGTRLTITSSASPDAAPVVLRHDELLREPVITDRGNVAAVAYSYDGHWFSIVSFVDGEERLIHHARRTVWITGGYGLFGNGARHPGTPMAIETAAVPAQDRAVMFIHQPDEGGDRYHLYLLDLPTDGLRELESRLPHDWNQPEIVGFFAGTSVVVRMQGSFGDRKPKNLGGGWESILTVTIHEIDADAGMLRPLFEVRLNGSRVSIRFEIEGAKCRAFEVEGVRPVLELDCGLDADGRPVIVRNDLGDGAAPTSPR